MRTKDILLDKFEDIKILQQYLYMGEDHFIIVTNSIGVKLEIRMNENLDYYCKNTNFPDLPESCWSSTMTNRTMLSIIEQLREEPPLEFSMFESRWEEIKSVCCANLSLNSLNKR